MTVEPNWYEINKAINFVTDSLRYPFVQEFYPMSLSDVIAYLNRLLRADPRHRQDDYAVYLTGLFEKWIAAGITTLPELAARCASQEKIIAAAQHMNFPIAEIHAVLHYTAYGLLPRNFYLRDLIEKGDAQMGEFCVTLRKAGYPNTLDLLQKARTHKGRAALSAETGVPEHAITELVNRADFTRMGTTGGNMVRNYMNSGITSFAMFVTMPVDTITQCMTEYLATLGKVPKYGMDIPSGHAQAQVLPRIVEP